MKKINLRKYAKGKECQVRFPGCSHNPEETVLAHIRTSSTGMGTKENDLFGAHACYNCNMISDGQKPLPQGYTTTQAKKEFYEGVFRTQALLIKEGVIRL